MIIRLGAAGDPLVVNPLRLLLVLLVATSILGGCLGDRDTKTGDSGVGDPGSRGEADPETLSLEAFTACAFTYPDNLTPVPCESSFVQVEIVSPDPPLPVDGWLCINDGSRPEPGAEVPEFGSWFFWHPATDMIGVYYYLDTTQPVNGIFFPTVHDGPAVAWTGGGPTGFVPLMPHPRPAEDPGLARDLPFYLMAYTLAYETRTEALEGGTVQLDWTRYEGNAYPTERIETAERTYRFDHVWQRPTKHWAVDPEPITGADFDLRFDFELLQERPSAMTLLPAAGCYAPQDV